MPPKRGKKIQKTDDAPMPDAAQETGVRRSGRTPKPIVRDEDIPAPAPTRKPRLAKKAKTTPNETSASATTDETSASATTDKTAAEAATVATAAPSKTKPAVVTVDDSEQDDNSGSEQDDSSSSDEEEEKPVAGKRKKPAAAKPHDEAAAATKLIQEAEKTGRRMCLSTAMSSYFLTRAELSTLPCEERRNPHYRSAAPMLLFDEADVISLAFQKHKTVDFNRLAQERREKKNEKKQKAEESRIWKEEAKEIRKRYIEDTLLDGMNLSKCEQALVQMYISNTPYEKEIESVAMGYTTKSKDAVSLLLKKRLQPLFQRHRKYISVLLHLIPEFGSKNDFWHTVTSYVRGQLDRDEEINEEAIRACFVVRGKYTGTWHHGITPNTANILDTEQIIRDIGTRDQQQKLAAEQAKLQAEQRMLEMKNRPVVYAGRVVNNDGPVCGCGNRGALACSSQSCSHCCDDKYCDVGASKFQKKKKSSEYPSETERACGARVQ